MVQLDEDFTSRLRAGPLLGRPYSLHVVIHQDPDPPVVARRLPPRALVEKNDPFPVFERLVTQALVALRQKPGTVARGKYAQQLGWLHFAGRGYFAKLASSAIALARASSAFWSSPCLAYTKAIRR